MNRDERIRVRALAREASTGPWKAETSHVWYRTAASDFAGGYHARKLCNVAYHATDGDLAQQYANARYLAAVSPDVVLALLDMLDEQERVMGGAGA